MSDVVRSELRGNVRWVTLDNPEKKNALDRPAMAALGEAFRTADADGETRVVVLSGAGRAFCAGADLVAAQKSLRHGEGTPPSVQDGPSQDSEFNATIRALWNCRKPVIAAVNGVAAGFGCSLVLASDVRIASSAARL
jgi:2-(1,2-epoxy-1,2-dihydrophenyl)acetyl-CoA isomerase